MFDRNDSFRKFIDVGSPNSFRFTGDTSFLRKHNKPYELDDKIAEFDSFASEVARENAAGNIQNIYKQILANDVVKQLFARARVSTFDIQGLAGVLGDLDKLITAGQVYESSQDLWRQLSPDEEQEVRRLAKDLWDELRSGSLDTGYLKYRFHKRAPIIPGSSFGNHFTNVVGLMHEAAEQSKSLDVAFFGVTSPDLIKELEQIAEKTQGNTRITLNESYGFGNKQHQLATERLSERAQVLVDPNKTMHAKFIGVGLDDNPHKASFFLGSPNLTAGAMGTWDNPMGSSIESSITFNYKLFQATKRSGVQDRVFGRIMGTAKAARDYLFNQGNSRSFTKISSLNASGVVTGQDLNNTNWEILEKAKVLGNKAKLTITTYSLPDYDSVDSYLKGLHEVIKAGGTVELILGRKVDSDAEKKLHERVAKLEKSLDASSKSRLIVTRYQRGLVHSKRTILSSRTPEDKWYTELVLEESGNKDQINDPNIKNIGFLQIGSEFDLEAIREQTEHLSLGIQYLRPSRLYDQGADAIAKNIVGAIQKRIDVAGALSSIGPESLRLSTSSSNQYVSIDLYRGSHKIVNFNIGRLNNDGRLFISNLNKFITPVIGAKHTSQLNDTANQVIKDNKFEFNEYEILAASISRLNQHLDLITDAMRYHMGMASAEQIMRDPYFRGFLRNYGRMKMQEIFQNFGSPEEGVDTYGAKQGSARLIFTQDETGLLQLDVPRIDSGTIHMGHLYDQGNTGVDGYLLGSKPVIFRPGGLSRFKARSEQTSAARAFDLDNFIDYLPIGTKVEEDYFFMMPIGKALQLPQRLGNIMSARSMELDRGFFAETKDGRILRGQSLFKPGNPGAAARDALRVQGYLVLGLAGDVGYLKGSYFNGQQVSKSTMIKSTWVDNRVSPVELGEFVSKLQNLPEMLGELSKLVKAYDHNHRLNHYKVSATLGADNRLHLNAEAVQLLESLRQMSEKDLTKIFGKESTKVLRMLPGLTLNTGKGYQTLETLTHKAARTDKAGLVIDLSTLAFEPTEKGTIQMSVMAKTLEHIKTGMRFIANFKAPVIVVDDTAEIFNSLDTIHSATAGELFTGGASNLIIGDSAIKSGDLLIQTGIEVIKNEARSKRLIGKLNAMSAADKLSKFTEIKAMWTRLGVSSSFIDLIDNPGSLIEKRIAGLRNQLLRGQSISLPDREAASLAALMFALSADEDLEESRHKLKKDLARGIGKYQSNSVDQKIQENLGVLGSIKIAGYAGLAANTTAISSRTTASFLSYFYDDTSYDLRRSFNGSKGTRQSTINSMALLLGITITDVEDRANSDIIVGRSLNPFSNFDPRIANELTQYHLWMAKSSDGLSLEDRLKRTRSLERIVNKTARKLKQPAVVQIGSGNVDVIRKYFEAQKKANIGARTLYIPKIGETASGRWFIYNVENQITTKLDSGHIQAPNYETIAVQLLDPTTLLNWGVYDNYAADIARIQYQIEQMLPSINRMFISPMGKPKSVVGSEAMPAMMLRPDLEEHEIDKFEKFMELTNKLQEVQRQIMATDNSKLLAGEVRARGRNLTAVGNNLITDRNIVVLGDDLYLQNYEEVKKTQRRNLRSLLGGKKLTAKNLVELSSVFDPAVRIEELFAEELAHDKFGVENELAKLKQERSLAIAEHKAQRKALFEKRKEVKKNLKKKVKSEFKQATGLDGVVYSTRPELASIYTEYNDGVSDLGLEAIETDSQIDEKIYDTITTFQAQKEALLEEHRLKSEELAAKFDKKIEVLLERMTEVIIDQSGGIPMAFQRAGSPTGPEGIVTLRAISASQANEKFNMHLNELANQSAILVNPDVMGVFFGDLDGDTVSVANMSRYIDLVTKTALKKTLGAEDQELKTKLDQLYKMSFEEQYIKHAYGALGLGIRPGHSSGRLKHGLYDLYFGNQAEQAREQGWSIANEIQEFNDLRKIRAGTGKASQELLDFESRLDSHMAIARQINSFTAGAEKYVNEVASIFGADHSTHKFEELVKYATDSGRYGELFKVFGGGDKGINSLSTKDLENIHQVAAIAATKMIGLTFNTVDSVNRLVNQDMSRIRYKTAIQAKANDPRLAGLDDPRDVVSRLERESGIGEFSQHVEHSNFMMSMGQLVQQAVRDAIKPKNQENMRLFLDEMKKSGAGAFTVSHVNPTGMFIDALRIVTTGEDLGLSIQEKAEPTRYDLSDLNTLIKLEERFVEGFASFLDNHTGAKLDKNNKNVIAELEGQDSKIFVENLKATNRENAADYFAILSTSGIVEYQKDLKAYRDAINSSGERFASKTGLISLENKIVMYEQLSSRSKFTNPDGLRAATQDLLDAVETSEELRAKIIENTGNIEMAHVLGRLKSMQLKDFMKGDIYEYLREEAGRNNMYRKAAKMARIADQYDLHDVNINKINELISTSFGQDVKLLSEEQQAKYKAYLDYKDLLLEQNFEGLTRGEDGFSFKNEADKFQAYIDMDVSQKQAIQVKAALRAQSRAAKDSFNRSATSGSIAKFIDNMGAPGITTFGMLGALGFANEDIAAEATKAVGFNLMAMTSPGAMTKMMSQEEKDEALMTGSMLLGSTAVGVGAFQGLSKAMSGHLSSGINKLVSSVGAAGAGLIAGLVSEAVLGDYLKKPRDKNVPGYEIRSAIEDETTPDSVDDDALAYLDPEEDLEELEAVSGWSIENVDSGLDMFDASWDNDSSSNMWG